MKNVCVTLVLIVATASVFAQQPDAVTNRERTRMSRTLNYGNWVGKQVMNAEFMEKVGIRDEQAKKIKADMDKIDARLKELEDDIHTAALQQAESAKKLLSKPGAPVDELMEHIERIGAMRTEQAKLSTQILVMIRDTLTEEQRTKSHELIKEEGRRRLKERMARRERDERPQPDTGDGRRPPRPAPPPRPAAPQGW